MNLITETLNHTKISTNILNPDINPEVKIAITYLEDS